MGYRVAVVGATGNVGREMLNILEEVNFPVDKIHAIASRKSIGVEVYFGDQIVKCEDIEQFDFSKVDIVLMSVSGDLLQGMVAEDRRGRPDRHRQFLGLADGPGRAADRAGGEPGRRRVGGPQEHHRQPQLLDRPAGGGAEAAARRGADQAGGGLDLPVGLRRRQGRHGRAVRPDEERLRPGRHAAEEVPQADRLQRHPLHRRRSRTTATPTKSRRCGTRPTRCSIRTSR